MSSQKLQRARQLLNEKRYEEARSVLLEISDDPTAAKWLSKLDEMAPTSASLFSGYEVSAQVAAKNLSNDKKEHTSQPRLTFLYLLNLVIIILFGLLLAGVLPIKVQLDEPVAVESSIANSQPALEQPITVDGSVDISEAIKIDGVVPVSIDQPIEIEGPLPVIFDTALLASAQDNPEQLWEYLTVQYSQVDLDPYDEFRSELVQSNDPAYDARLISEYLCNDPFGFESPIEECYEKFKGQAFFLNLWGNDGWELISATSTSSNIQYTIEMVFKRPRKS